MGDSRVRGFHIAWIKLTCVHISSIIDAHSHQGIFSRPFLSGAKDGNSLNGPILPWLRSLDGLNTHDESYTLSIAGGVTTALILPGSVNAIGELLMLAEHRHGDLTAYAGGQAFTIKLRKTAERSTTSMLLEPPYQLNGTYAASGVVPWRHIQYDIFLVD